MDLFDELRVPLFRYGLAFRLSSHDCEDVIQGSEREEPFTAKNWSAYTKDDLEDRLHELVCSGKLDLSAAQHEIATDWIGAYQKYVQSGNPSVRRSVNL